MKLYNIYINTIAIALHYTYRLCMTRVKKKRIIIIIPNKKDMRVLRGMKIKNEMVMIWFLLHLLFYIIHIHVKGKDI